MWHYLDGSCEPCTYSPEPVEASSPTSSSVTAPSALSSLIPTAAASSSPASETDTSPASPSGMTCAPSTGSRGEEALTSSQAGSPVRTSAAPARAQASTANAPGSGAKWREWFVKYDRDSSSWKTHQCSLLGGLAGFSETWPRWGSMRGGACWELTTQAPRTDVRGSGSWPTPCTRDHKDSGENVDWSKVAAKGKLAGAVMVSGPDGDATMQGGLRLPDPPDAGDPHRL